MKLITTTLKDCHKVIAIMINEELIGYFTPNAAAEWRLQASTSDFSIHDSYPCVGTYEVTELDDLWDNEGFDQMTGG